MKNQPVYDVSTDDGGAEFIFGLKIENPRSDANVETSVRVPGIGGGSW